VSSSFPADQIFHDKSNQPRPWPIKQRQQIRQAGAYGRGGRAGDHHGRLPRKRMPRSGGPGRRAEGDSDVGCGGPLPLANHDPISLTATALCVDTFFQPRQSPLRRISKQPARLPACDPYELHRVSLGSPRRRPRGTLRARISSPTSALEHNENTKSSTPRNDCNAHGRRWSAGCALASERS